LSEYEVQKLKLQMRNELNTGLPALLRCAAGLLLIVIGAVVLSPGNDPLLDRPSEVAQAQAQAQGQASLARYRDGDELRGARVEAQSPVETVSNLIPAASVSLQTIR
jgi:hypothetical protein